MLGPHLCLRQPQLRIVVARAVEHRRGVGCGSEELVLLPQRVREALPPEADEARERRAARVSERKAAFQHRLGPGAELGWSLEV